MREFIARHRHLSLLAAVLLGQLFFLAFQIKSHNDVRLIRVWAMAAIAPVEKVFYGVVDGAGYLLETYIALYDARQETRRLQAELDQARLRVQKLEAQAAEATELAALLDFKQAHRQAPLVAAQVIGSNPGASTLTVLINRGREDGLEANQPVITPQGVVGKVIAAFPGAAQVLLLTDEKSGVGAMTAGSHVLGVAKGTGRSYCRLEYVPNQETVEVGGEVLTSGQDQLFPKGLPLGRVTSVRPGEYFQEITVQPAARLTRLEHVLVLAGPPGELVTAAQNDTSAEEPAR